MIKRLTPRSAMAAAMFFWVGFATVGAAADGLFIQRVATRRIEPGRDPFSALSGSSNELGKFDQVVARDRGVRRGEEISVVWRSDGRVRGERVDVVMDIRQANADEPRRMTLSYRSTDAGVAESIFRVTGAAFNEGGRIKAWRTTLVVNGRVLDSRASALWNEK